MGWNGGSDLCNDIWLIVRDYIDLYEQKEVANKLFELFKEHDTDNWGRNLDIEAFIGDDDN